MEIEIRLVKEDDASFITEMRSNSALNQHLSTTPPDIASQVKWIKEYKKREAKKEEFYFVVLEKGVRKGLYRVYLINTVSFTLGSWLFKPCDHKQIPVLTDVLMCEFGYRALEKTVMLFDVRKSNNKVIRYTSIKKPLFYTEDKLTNYYLLKAENWETAKANVLNFFRINQEDYQLFKDCYNRSNALQI